MNDDRILIGKIVKPHGVDGTLLIEILTDFPEERFYPGASLHIEQGGRESTRRVTEASPHGERWRIRFNDCEDRDQAEELRGARIVIPEEEVIGDGKELYDFDLIGMQVYDTNDNKKGTIEDVTYVGSRPLLQIDPGQGESFDFPAHEELVEGFNRNQGWIRLKFPKGWNKHRKS